MCPACLLVQLFFRTPEVYEARELGIEHFTFSTSWENVALTPLIAAAQLQQAFSREIGVTLLAANYGVSWKTSGRCVVANVCAARGLNTCNHAPCNLQWHLRWWHATELHVQHR